MAASKGSRKESIKTLLDNLLQEFNQPEFLKNDPVGIVHEYRGKENQEVVALIAALFAFGNVKMIRRTIRDILKPLEENPAENLMSLSNREIENIWSKIYYRFYSPQDIQNFLKSLKNILKEFKGLEAAFISADSKDHLTALLQFRDLFIKKLPPQSVTRGLKFMFSDPNTGTAKRWHLLLRWLVRKDKIDLGLWTHIKPSHLIQPLDTHLFQIGRRLSLISTKTASLKAALEMTEHFKTWSPDDPIRYDFALCQMGIQRLTEKKLTL